MSIPFLNKNLRNIASVVASVGSIKGRKKLQKMIFILKNLGAPFQERFKLYYFGPYSVDLQLELEELSLLKIIEEIWDGNLCLYNFKSEELKKNFLDNSEVKEYIPVIKELNKTNTSVLELLSTYLYLIRVEENEEIARKKLKIIKPHLYSKFEEALNLWERIRLN
ncbi:MAG: hypothetical protein Q9M37_09310 [Desulfonauticus sp.]|nr:hypothetical protein [Desulfonauticus sp.]